ncbi:hypothetical protein ABT168_32725 [Streptomyces sp. NPDC001793]|uniref:hypothetical protein n=1 Tax=Streptomyces sp. NPDC001793 TaxID=3154657 RepID=UPI00331AAB17
MADDRYSWLDKEAAERLLRGEPAGSQVGDGARELEQLLKAAAAAGSGLPETAAAPGEEAALAAFRQARLGTGARSRGAAPPGTRTTRTNRVVERTGLARPFRRGLAVALAACAISGIAVAAGTGVLPTPFRDGEPRPGASVPAAETPDTFGTDESATTTGETGRTPATPPDGRTTAPGSTPTPGGSPDTVPAPGTRSPGTGTGTPGDDGKPLPDDGGGNKKRKLLLAVCKEYESGRRGDLDRDTLRRLEGTAGGAERVHAFCRQYLAQAGQQGGGSGDNDGGGGGKGGHGGGQGENGGNGGGKNGGGSGDEEGDPPRAASPPAASPSPGAPTTGSTPTPAPSTAAPTPSGNLPTGRV